MKNTYYGILLTLFAASATQSQNLPAQYVKGSAHYIDDNDGSSLRSKLLVDGEFVDSSLGPVTRGHLSKNQNNNSTSRVTAGPGKSLNFDGTDDVVTSALPSPFTDIGSNNFTIETWIKPDAPGTSRIFFAQKDGSNFVSGLLSSAIEPYFYVYASGRIYSISAPALTAGAWSHLAFVWNALTLTPTIFINGVLATSSPGGSSSTNLNNTFYLGGKSTSQYFRGSMDELRIWSKMLTQTQISESMNCEIEGDSPSLVLSYNFNNGTDGANNSGLNTLADGTSNANDGTLINFALNGTTSNWVSDAATNCSVLPVKLVSFTGNTERGTAILTWKVAEEENFSHFEVEKLNGDKSFTKEKTVYAKGSNSAYDAVLSQPEKDAYYRLKMVDLDDTFAYSRLIHVKNSDANNIASPYPNPARKSLFVKMASEGNVNIYNQSGGMISSSKMSAGEHAVPIENLTPGPYVIHLNGSSFKFIKQ